MAIYNSYVKLPEGRIYLKPHGVGYDFSIFSAISFTLTCNMDSDVVAPQTILPLRRVYEISVAVRIRPVPTAKCVVICLYVFIFTDIYTILYYIIKIYFIILYYIIIIL